MSDDEFSAIFPASRLSGGTFGVRVYPFVKDASGNKIFISQPNIVLCVNNSGGTYSDCVIGFAGNQGVTGHT